MSQAHAATNDERSIAGHAGRLFVALADGVAVTEVGRCLVAPLLSRTIGELGITTARAGIALSIASAALALMQYPSGRLSDRLSRRTIPVVSLGLLVTGFVLLVGAPTYAAFAIAVALIGAGVAILAATYLTWRLPFLFVVGQVPSDIPETGRRLFASSRARRLAARSSLFVFT